jgi:hypothetical protein
VKLPSWAVVAASDCVAFAHLLSTSTGLHSSRKAQQLQHELPSAGPILQAVPIVPEAVLRDLEYFTEQDKR